MRHPNELYYTTKKKKKKQMKYNSILHLYRCHLYTHHIESQWPLKFAKESTVSILYNLFLVAEPLSSLPAFSPLWKKTRKTKLKKAPRKALNLNAARIMLYSGTRGTRWIVERVFRSAALRQLYSRAKAYEREGKQYIYTLARAS